MLISHGLCWSRSAESSIPFPRKRWPRRNTTHGTRPLWLPAGADPILEISLIISYGIKPGTPQALWDTPMQDATAGNAGQSQAPGTAPYTPCKEWSILFQHHIRELFALSSQSSCSPGLVLQRFPLALPSINNNLFSSSSHTSKNWSCLLNFFFWSFTLHTLLYPTSQSTINNACPSYPEDEQSSKGLTTILKS